MRMVDGKVDQFRTTVTGELFALLKRHSLLADFLTGAVVDGSAFRAGAAAAADSTLLSDLFAVRGTVLLGLRPLDEAAAYVSGLLIGSDVREQSLARSQCVHVLADPSLGSLYATAIASVGAQAVTVDSHAAFVTGITAIWREAHAPTC